MKLKLTTYFVLMMQVIAGMALLVLIQQLKAPSNLKTVFVFISLLSLNFLYVPLFHLKADLASYWSLRKLYYLPAGVVAGFLLIIIPMAGALVAGKLNVHAVQIDSVSMTSIFFTFLIIGWEELWFRSLLLNYCNRHLSKFNIAITVGLLFMLIHILNPEISLVKEGPELFLAGTLLTALYFYYRNIWVPVGLHFGNNYFGSIIHTNINDHSLFGSEGYNHIFLLLVAVIFFLMKLRRSGRENFD